MSIQPQRPGTDQQVREPTRLTGESRADAVVEQRLDRIRRADQDAPDLLTDLQSQVASETLDSDDLYDEYGLPR